MCGESTRMNQCNIKVIPNRVLSSTLGIPGNTTRSWQLSRWYYFLIMLQLYMVALKLQTMHSRCINHHRTKYVSLQRRILCCRYYNCYCVAAFSRDTRLTYISMYVVSSQRNLKWKRRSVVGSGCRYVLARLAKVFEAGYLSRFLFQCSPSGLAKTRSILYPS